MHPSNLALIGLLPACILGDPALDSPPSCSGRLAATRERLAGLVPVHLYRTPRGPIAFSLHEF